MTCVQQKEKHSHLEKKARHVARFLGGVKTGNRTRK
jgi:hypothetical protein